MKKTKLMYSFALAASLFLTACSGNQQQGATEATTKPETVAVTEATTEAVTETEAETTPETETVTADGIADGTYRGFYQEGGIDQVSIQFEIKDGKFEKVVYRALEYRDGDYLDENATDIQKQIKEQYEQAAEYIIGKDASAVPELLDSTLVSEDMDAVTSATLRSNKLASAIHDGINRGVYKLSDTTVLLQYPVYADGTYRGFYIDGGVDQVVASFELKDNKFESVKYRSLKYSDGDYLAEDANEVQKQIAEQYTQAADYLVGKDISAIADLYAAETVAEDMDAVTSATLRTSKLISALNDGLARGPYAITESTKLPALSAYEDGVYRGFYQEGGSDQVAVNFEIKDNQFVKITYRGMNYRGDNYLDDNAGDVQKAILEQYTQATDYLIGKDINAVWDLYDVSEIVEDIDAVTSATLRSSKVISAIVDGLNRGVYQNP